MEEGILARSENDTVIDRDYNEDEEPPMLSSHALAALKEFLEEQNIAKETEEEEEGKEDKVNLVTEDWRLSQFWYDQLTAETIAKEVIYLLRNNDIDSNSRAAACIACPTLYAYMKKMEPDVSVKLLEYDKRFGQYGTDFTFYDYNQPEDLNSELKHSFHVIVADPPYLSKECLEKVTQTIFLLAKPGKSHLLLLTGEVQRNRAAELLGLRPCGFRPQHSSKLGNEFRLFTNYDPETRLGGWELEQ